eukprot:CAMPEP_0170268976 /NCGR_PEP_ID=MMETSP0116_2-20130129/34421_1 /TAXON_ID=400756 /ORGANISM="Durinskia baltica, Strain CSIRO CS-38" /LENGTH=177 /DNA_ID=CAMNT_0010520145 /DNA_START=147 /DNA_END=681 /DNA_ORIENTATION=+
MAKPQGILLLLLAGVTLLWGTQAHQEPRTRIAGTKSGRILSIEEYGAVADRSITMWSFRNLEDDDDAEEENDDLKVTGWDIHRAINNTIAFNLAIHAARPGDIVVVPDGKSFSFTGGIIANFGTGIAMGQDDGGTEDHVHVAMTDVSAENDWILVCGRERIKRYQRSSCPSHNRLMI